jgi:protein OS-9
MRVRSLAAFGALPLSLIDLAAARALHSLPEDPAAFPKFRVSYLNGLPILNSTAEIWLAEGLRGGEAEFLEQPWEENDHHWDRQPQRKEIGAGDDVQHVMDSAASTSGYRLEHMKLGPKHGFLCLIPPHLQPLEPDPSEVEAEHSIDPVHAWSLLQPLTGGCLYVRYLPLTSFNHLLRLFL